MFVHKTRDSLWLLFMLRHSGTGSIEISNISRTCTDCISAFYSII